MGKSALLLFLSEYKEHSTKSTYKFAEEGISFEGTQTNDAPSKALLYLAAKAGLDGTENLQVEPISLVLCIVSKKVYTKEISEKFTQYDQYQKVISDYVKSRDNAENNAGIDIEEIYKRTSIEFIPIYYDFLPETVTGKVSIMEDPALRVYHQLSNLLKDREVSDVYIDYTGGFRDTSLLMTTIIRYMRFNGVNLRRIIYSKFDKTIHDIGYIDEMFQMVEAVNEFVSTGSARQLQELFPDQEKSEAEARENKVSNTKKVLNAINKFSNAVLICDVDSIGFAVNEMRASLDDLENEEIFEQEILTYMLKTLTPVIRKKMYLPNNESSSDNTIGQSAQSTPENIYPGLIRWSLDNWMLQQAVTMYVEKMPSVYRRSNDGVSFTGGLFPESFYNGGQGSRPKKDSELLYQDVFWEYWEHAVPDVISNFRNCVKQVLDRWNNQNATGNLQDLINLLITEELNTPSYYNDEKRGLRRLREYLEHWRDTSVPGNIYGESLVGGRETPEDLLNKLTEEGPVRGNGILVKQKLYRHYFLFEGAQHNQNGSEIRASFTLGRDFTYRRKIMAMKNISDEAAQNNSGGRWGSLLKILQYYIAVKLIRNRMNHASETGDLSTDAIEDEDALIDYLRDEAGIIIDNNAKNIREVLSNGLKITNP